jgi:hypothetical protein
MQAFYSFFLFYFLNQVPDGLSLFVIQIYGFSKGDPSVLAFIF